MFLTDDEFHTLTGLRRPSAQIRWLRSRHVRHYVNATGHPVIARAWLVGHAENCGHGAELSLRNAPARA